jgi:hypothetical protein
MRKRVKLTGDLLLHAKKSRLMGSLGAGNGTLYFRTRVGTSPPSEPLIAGTFKGKVLQEYRVFGE